ncbi:family 20 glycosylhydrolase [Panacibacter ginsenosidivorans]|uniref:beta-N-acetylhexosaminidase n=1 Tax=Panacibacter ginsenosidivorans TaxID=1813871 RepID=A0A5B8VCX0_9BACT|nr:beta-N-acetylhexosaminidase [Panacibacter ginsenosidivorans]QEC69119.1 family 20 glycosylhydrolase [Panacibacter ginsenosidivorans]
MKKLLIAAIVVLMCMNAFSQGNGSIVSLIPIPVSMQMGQGNFTLKNNTSIELATTDPDAKRVAGFLAEKLSVTTGFKIPVKPVNKASNANGNIALAIVQDATFGNEGYKLNVTPNSISLSANKAAGLFYAMQTLLQLLPKEIESSKVVNNIEWNVPGVTITDYPRFGWRALMFDVSRHFFTKQDVKTFIDNMIRYKYNLLHLHLTDDQGWRIEIKSLPELTKVGAWRPERKGAWANAKPVTADEPKTYGGFYTQDDIREIVQYAKERFVTILPEVDIPGHSMAAVATYPQLSCTPGTYFVNAGEETQVWEKNGNRALIDNTLCPANENVYEFLDKVFTEVAQLFPFEYIHVGGDEAAKNFWEQSEAVKALMQREGLKNMEEVQSYFIKRVEKIVQSKGKKMIGWDEILQGGLAPEATVMSWRGMKGGIEAAKQGHHVVMAPKDYTYVELMQGDPYVEPPEFDILLLDQSYKFEPVPDGVDPKLILGGEACLWSEHVTNMRAAGYELWPRAWAVAESVWSPKENKNWPDFVTRTENQFQRLDIAKIKYSRSMYDPLFIASFDNKGQLKVELHLQVPGLVAYYSFDETNPDEFYPAYKEPLIVPEDALHVKVLTYRDGKPIGKQINMPVEELVKRAKKE